MADLQVKTIVDIAERSETDDYTAADINDNNDNVQKIKNDIINSIVGSDQVPPRDMETLDTDLAIIESKMAGFRENVVRMQPYGCWFEIEWSSNTQIIIRPKAFCGEEWIGVVLSDDSYLELTSAYTLDISTTGEGGRLSGNSGILNSQWYIIYAFEDSGGNLDFGFSWMPKTTFSNANPTNALTLNTVGSENIGYLFPAGARLVVWQDTDEWETPLAWWNVSGSPTISKSKDKPKVSSRTATVLTLGASLENTDFTASSTVYQVGGFKPLQLSDGAIASVIGARGYKDTGIRIPTNASGYIINFVVINGEFYFANGSGSADYTQSQGVETLSDSTSWANYRFTFCPPDKCGIISAYNTSGYLVYTKPYYQTYGEAVAQLNSSAVFLRQESRILHGIFSAKSQAASTHVPRGYII